VQPTVVSTAVLATRRRIVLVAVAAALAACSPGGPPAAAPAATATPTTAPTTTIATTTTAAPTTTAEDPEVAAVRQAHLDYLAMFELVGDPPDPDHPELARTATGDAYDRLRANLAQDLLQGNRLVGGWESAIQSIEIDGDQATVVDCLLDTGVVYGADGTVLVPADDFRALGTSRLERHGDGWKVWRLEFTDPPERCDA
jgi:hypothetical protein